MKKMTKEMIFRKIRKITFKAIFPQNLFTSNSSKNFKILKKLVNCFFLTFSLAA